ncbi:MAG: DedA family protein [Pseudomonadota bacterium]
MPHVGQRTLERALEGLLSLFLHLDQHLQSLVTDYGAWVYAILFLIVFCETGLVVFPFLPGDSLLFVAGTLAGAGLLDAMVLMVVLIVAAVAGDAVNYAIGRRAGAAALQGSIPYIKQEHLLKTQRFYERHGGKTIIIARFLPIIRTFAPFVAGVGRMEYSEFLKFNIVGAVLWVVSLVTAGYFLGGIPVVKNNLTAVILLIIALSLLPGIIEYLRHRNKG